MLKRTCRTTWSAAISNILNSLLKASTNSDSFHWFGLLFTAFLELIHAVCCCGFVLLCSQSKPSKQFELL